MECWKRFCLIFGLISVQVTISDSYGQNRLITVHESGDRRLFCKTEKSFFSCLDTKKGTMEIREYGVDKDCEIFEEKFEGICELVQNKDTEPQSGFSHIPTNCAPGYKIINGICRKV